MNRNIRSGNHLPKPLIICGHPRSGTTLINSLCNSHPQIAMTFEFLSFLSVGRPYTEYVQNLNKDWRKRPLIRAEQVPNIRREWRKHPLVASRVLLSRKTKTWNQLANQLFLWRFLRGLRRNGNAVIDLQTVLRTLHNIFPRALVVGDKMPEYVFHLEDLVDLEGLNRLAIYRNCFDVVSSYLNMARTVWKDEAFAARFNTAEPCAARWVEAIELMERHADRLYVLRYEDLVRDPEGQLRAIARWLDVDPAGFLPGVVRGNSVGKFRHGLSKEEIATVNRVAGPTMERLGYGEFLKG